MNPQTLRQQHLTRRSQAKQVANRGFVQGKAIETGNTLKVDVNGSVIEAENLAGGVVLGGMVLVYQPANSGRAYARPKSGLVP